ncbi:transcriptional regulator with XRE-family HTH domain [Azospirillum agricola]|uniref:helix-turn-helix transcriptional regulator n=1 Tax=Azospirillum agricola TaxID=1720247 RepID=UPI001AE776FD|nr:helix-turn-helix domain-containing protein [Azospirillum agricola]MBP2229690.1 transcriptional regulator with XRE-family HTH domain [Azospirillum agricola]
MSQIAPRQIRAARALLGWSQAELADKAIVSLSSVIRLEKGQGTTTDIYFRVCQALEGAGIVFLPAGRRGEGVRLSTPEM